VQDPTWFDANLPDWRSHSATLFLYQGMQSRNPPDHTRLRRVVGGTFAPRRLEALRQRVEHLTDRLLDGMAEAGGGGQPVDLMEALASPLPVAVIGELLGIPEGDRARFRSLATDFFNVMDLFKSDEAQRLADTAADKLRAYWVDMAAERRRRPTDDLTTTLVRAADAGDVSEDELAATLMFLFTAGYGTTAALIGNATAALLDHPDQAARLRADPTVAPAVVEETLRYEAPAQINPRLALRNVVVGGIRYSAGQFIVIFLGAANRDPARFLNPDRFDIDRADTHVLSFGGGIHHCLGAALSRIEATIVLPRLLRRFPKLALAGEPVRRPASRMRVHLRLPVSLDGS